MKLLFVIQNIGKIIQLNWQLKKHTFQEIILDLMKKGYKGKKHEVADIPRLEKSIIPRLEAIESASAIYWGKAKCLQRSLLQYALLRNKYGLDVDLVIGVKRFPFSSHAWVQWHNTNRIACGSPEEIVGYEVIFSTDAYKEQQ